MARLHPLRGGGAGAARQQPRPEGRRGDERARPHARAGDAEAAAAGRRAARGTRAGARRAARRLRAAGHRAPVLGQRPCERARRRCRTGALASPARLHARRTSHIERDIARGAAAERGTAEARRREAAEEGRVTESVHRQHYNVTFALLAMAAVAYALLQSLVAPALLTIQHDLD